MADYYWVFASIWLTHFLDLDFRLLISDFPFQVVEFGLEVQKVHFCP